MTLHAMRKPNLPSGLKMRYRVMYGVTKSQPSKLSFATASAWPPRGFPMAAGAGLIAFADPRLCGEGLARAPQAPRLSKTGGRNAKRDGTIVVRHLGTCRCFGAGACR